MNKREQQSLHMTYCRLNLSKTYFIVIYIADVLNIGKYLLFVSTNSQNPNLYLLIQKLMLKSVSKVLL